MKSQKTDKETKARKADCAEFTSSGVLCMMQSNIECAIYAAEYANCDMNINHMNEVMKVMSQSIPWLPIPPPGVCRAFSTVLVPRVGHLLSAG
jgi:hypothetical protein